MYRIVRFYFDSPTRNRRVIRRGLTLEEARAWCQRKDTSSSTCTPAQHKARCAGATRWFDGYEECDK